MQDELQNTDVVDVGELKSQAVGKRMFDSTDSEAVYPKDWENEAFKANVYFRRNSYARSSINAFITLAFGEQIYPTQVSENVKIDDILAILKKKKVLAHVKSQLKTLLIKGDFVGFFESDKGMAREINPIGVVPTYKDGELSEVKQYPVTNSKTSVRVQKSATSGTALALEDVYHTKWDAPSYESHGNPMLLPAFEDMLLLADLRAADRATAKRWADPIVYFTVGGMVGTKFVKTTQAMLDDTQKTLNESDKRATLVFPPWVEGHIMGTEGQVLDTESRKRMAQENIAVATGFPRTLLTGDGATFSTAKVASDKLALTLDSIREVAWEYLNWLFGKILGVEDLSIEWGHKGFSQFSSDTFKQVISTMFEQNLIGRRTAQKWLSINPDEEAKESERDQLRLKSSMSAQDIVGLVGTGVLTTDEAREFMGLGAGAPAAAKQIAAETQAIYDKTAKPGAGA